MSPSRQGFVLLFATLFAACEETNSDCTQEACVAYGEDLIEAIDDSIDPCDDFYSYACGSWIKSRSPETASILDDQEAIINERVKEILEGPVKRNEAALRKAQAMNKHCLTADGPGTVSSVKTVMKRYGGWPLIEGSSWDDAQVTKKWKENLFLNLGTLRRSFPSGGLFDIEVLPNLKKTPGQMLNLNQPSIQIFTSNMSDDEMIAQASSLYRLASTFNTKITAAEVGSDAFDMFELWGIIDNSLLDTDSDDLAKAVHITTVGELSKRTKVDWQKWLNIILQGITEVVSTDEIEVDQMEYFVKLGQYINGNQSHYRTIMNYELLTSLYNDMLPAFSSVSDKSMCVDIVKNAYIYALGNKYASEYLDADAIVENTKEITHTTAEAFSERLKSVDWLDSKSRKGAAEKLDAMKEYYLYPDWADSVKNINEFYQKLKPKNDFLQDIVASSEFNTLYNYNTWKKTPKFLTWFISLMTVNAFYDQSTNDLSVLEGIMQPPIYHEDRLMCMNFGSLGSIVGHEITHGFDTKGVQFDSNGDLFGWLSSSSKKKFKTRAQCLVDQYSGYELTSEELPGSDGYKVDGETTLSENIADNGGLGVAYYGYKKWVDEHGEEKLPEGLQKFSSDQVFFLSFAKTWCKSYENSSDWPQVLAGDSHSPNKFRVNGAVSNLDAFSEAFQCSEGSKMNRGDKRCSLW